jgi:RNA polymerase sigma-70 factor, ECF subfamily
MKQVVSFKQQLLGSVPALRAFGMSLTGRFDLTDDLVQETLTKAWEHQSSFEPGTNLRAWLFTILRNTFLTEIRKRKREIEDVDGQHGAKVAHRAEQPGILDMADFQHALDKLPDEQREALVLVGASGFSYEEAAQICEVAVGTIKSRVNRARVHLKTMLPDMEEALSLESER